MSGIRSVILVHLKTLNSVEENEITSLKFQSRGKIFDPVSLCADHVVEPFKYSL